MIDVPGTAGKSAPSCGVVRMRDSNDNDRPAVRGPTLNAMLRASDGILDMLPIATYICDARGTILQYNSRAVELWGRAPDPGPHDHRCRTSVVPRPSTRCPDRTGKRRI